MDTADKGPAVSAVTPGAAGDTSDSREADLCERLVTPPEAPLPAVAMATAVGETVTIIVRPLRQEMHNLGDCTQIVIAVVDGSPPGALRNPGRRSRAKATTPVDGEDVDDEDGESTASPGRRKRQTVDPDDESDDDGGLDEDDEEEKEESDGEWEASDDDDEDGRHREKRGRVEDVDDDGFIVPDGVDDADLPPLAKVPKTGSAAESGDEKESDSPGSPASVEEYDDDEEDAEDEDGDDAPAAPAADDGGVNDFMSNFDMAPVVGSDGAVLEDGTRARKGKKKAGGRKKRRQQSESPPAAAAAPIVQSTHPRLQEGAQLRIRGKFSTTCPLMRIAVCIRLADLDPAKPNAEVRATQADGSVIRDWPHDLGQMPPVILRGEFAKCLSRIPYFKAQGGGEQLRKATKLGSRPGDVLTAKDVQELRDRSAHCLFLGMFWTDDDLAVASVVGCPTLAAIRSSQLASETLNSILAGKPELLLFTHNVRPELHSQDPMSTLYDLGVRSLSVQDLDRLPPAARALVWSKCTPRTLGAACAAHSRARAICASHGVTCFPVRGDGVADGVQCLVRLGLAVTVAGGASYSLCVEYRVENELAICLLAQRDAGRYDPSPEAAAARSRLARPGGGGKAATAAQPATASPAPQRPAMVAVAGDRNAFNILVARAAAKPVLRVTAPVTTATSPAVAATGPTQSAPVTAEASSAAPVSPEIEAAVKFAESATNGGLVVIDGGRASQLVLVSAIAGRNPGRTFAVTFAARGGADPAAPANAMAAGIVSRWAIEEAARGSPLALFLSTDQATSALLYECLNAVKGCGMPCKVVLMGDSTRPPLRVLAAADFGMPFATITSHPGVFPLCTAVPPCATDSARSVCVRLVATASTPRAEIEAVCRSVFRPSGGGGCIVGVVEGSGGCPPRQVLLGPATEHAVAVCCCSRVTSEWRASAAPMLPNVYAQGDRVAVLSGGQVQATGILHDVSQRKASLFGAAGNVVFPLEGRAATATSSFFGRKGLITNDVTVTLSDPETSGRRSEVATPDRYPLRHIRIVQSGDLPIPPAVSGHTVLVLCNHTDRSDIAAAARATAGASRLTVVRSASCRDGRSPEETLVAACYRRRNPSTVLGWLLLASALHH